MKTYYKICLLGTISFINKRKRRRRKGRMIIIMVPKLHTTPHGWGLLPDSLETASVVVLKSLCLLCSTNKVHRPARWQICWCPHPRVRSHSSSGQLLPTWPRLSLGSDGRQHAHTVGSNSSKGWSSHPTAVTHIRRTICLQSSLRISTSSRAACPVGRRCFEIFLKAPLHRISWLLLKVNTLWSAAALMNS